MNTADYEILVNMTPGNARPPEFAVKLLEDICERTGVDWKARHAYLMQRGGKWGVTLSIDGFRLIGSQDPEFAGQEGPYWVTSSEGQWTDIPPDGPIYAAKVGIKHRNGGTTWGVAKFKDYAAGPMWNKFPSTMIAKCAEMLAWRKAMPGKLGGLYGTEEMAQAVSGTRGASTKGSESEESADGMKSGDLPPSSGSLALENGYVTALSTATKREELMKIGARITADKGLDAGAVERLHKLYTELKAKL